MNRVLLLCGLLCGSAAVVCGPAAAADVHVGINIGIPAPPPIVVTAPPRLVVVPTTPAVRYAPDISFNFFAYGGRYYTAHEGAWFVATAYGGPWTYVERAPHAVRIVPARYYRIPPGHRKKAYGKKAHGHPHGGPPGHAYGHEKHGRGGGH